MDRRGLLVLTYHRVLGERDPLRPDELDARTFDRHMAVLARFCNVLPLVEAVERLRSASLPRQAVCVTFDDGYADNFDIALPTLRRWGLPATFFVASGFLNGGRMWNDTLIEAVRALRTDVLDLGRWNLGRYPLRTHDERRHACYTVLRRLRYLPPAERDARVDELAAEGGADLPKDLMMSSAQVRALCDHGMEVGAHTVNHPILARLEDAAARCEIEDSKRALEQSIGRPVRVFAYPNGRPGDDFLPHHVGMVRAAGFVAALTTADGIATRYSDPFQLPRFAPWDSSAVRFLLRLRHYRWRRRDLQAGKPLQAS